MNPTAQMIVYACTAQEKFTKLGGTAAQLLAIAKAVLAHLVAPGDPALDALGWLVPRDPTSALEIVTTVVRAQMHTDRVLSKWKAVCTQVLDETTPDQREALLSNPDESKAILRAGEKAKMSGRIVALELTKAVEGPIVVDSVAFTLPECSMLLGFSPLLHSVNELCVAVPRNWAFFTAIGRFIPDLTIGSSGDDGGDNIDVLLRELVVMVIRYHNHVVHSSNVMLANTLPIASASMPK